MDKLYLGKTLDVIAEETEPDYYGGYSVFILYDENDPNGREVAMSYSVQAILKEHPELSDFVVKKTNDFYGTRVLRVLKTRENEDV